MDDEEMKEITRLREARHKMLKSDENWENEWEKTKRFLYARSALRKQYEKMYKFEDKSLQHFKDFCRLQGLYSGEFENWENKSIYITKQIMIDCLRKT